MLLHKPKLKLITTKQPHMPSFKINVTIENKPEIADPEGDTILHDLVLKGNRSTVKKIRSAKMLKFEVDAKNKKLAEKMVMDLCNEFRIYNPLVSRVYVESTDA
jgi:phosphoribosylformylglycinamidine synthase